MKILVIRFSSLGDVVLTTALFPNLKNKWPESQVTVLTKAPYAPLFDRNPFVDHVRLYNPTQQPFSQLVKELREEDFDMVVDLQANLRSWITRFLAGAPITVVAEKLWLERQKLVYLKRTSPALSRSVRERNLDTLKSLDAPLINEDTLLYPDPNLDPHRTFDLNPALKLIGIAPGAQHAAKQWSADSFAEAANRLGAATDTLVLILGDKADTAVAQEVVKRLVVPFKNLAGLTRLQELIALISRLSLLLTNDSGLLHIAEALKIPLVALFGPTVRSFGFAPYRTSSRVAEVANLACRPCSLHGGEACPLRHHKCMKDIDVNAVLFVASEILDHENSSPR